MSLVPNRTSLPSRCYCPIPQAHRTILYFYFGSRSPLSPASTDVERLQIYLYKKRLWVCSGIHQRDEWSFSFLSFCAASSYFPQEIYILNALHRHMEALVLGLGLDPFFFCVSSPPIRFSIPFVFVFFFFPISFPLFLFFSRLFLSLLLWRDSSVFFFLFFHQTTRCLLDSWTHGNESRPTAPTAGRIEERDEELFFSSFLPEIFHSLCLFFIFHSVGWGNWAVVVGWNGVGRGRCSIPLIPFSKHAMKAHACKFYRTVYTHSTHVTCVRSCRAPSRPWNTFLVVGKESKKMG